MVFPGPRGAAVWVFLVLVAAEMSVPVFAEAAGRTQWHPGHMAERYRLFTIIVLGEAISAGTLGVNATIADKTSFSDLATVIIGGLLTAFSMWWIYFDMPSEEIVAAVRRAFNNRLNGAFVWGYGRYLVFASVATTGAGLAVALDQFCRRSRPHSARGGLLPDYPGFAVPAGDLGVARPVQAPGHPLRSLGAPVTAVLVLATRATSQPVLATGLLLTVLLALTLVSAHRPARGGGRRGCHREARRHHGRVGRLKP